MAILCQGGQAGAGHQAFKPGILRGIDHRGFWQADAALAAGFDEGLLAMADQQHRIRRHTGLPGVEGLARQNIPRGAFEIRPRQHQHRTFAAQFSVSGVRFGAAAAMILRPVAVLPVKTK